VRKFPSTRKRNHDDNYVPIIANGYLLIKLYTLKYYKNILYYDEAAANLRGCLRASRIGRKTPLSYTTRTWRGMHAHTYTRKIYNRWERNNETERLRKSVSAHGHGIIREIGHATTI